MNRIITIVLAAALAACSPAAPPGAAPPSTAATTPTATPTSDKPAASEGTTLTSAMLVGRWGDNGDCTKDIVLNADGTFTSYTGGGGRWSLNGDRMTMTGANGTFVLGVSILNQNTLIISNPDGSMGTSQRC